MNVIFYILSGLVGLVAVGVLLSLVTMWLSAPVFLYLIFQKVSSIEKKMGK